MKEKSVLISHDGIKVRRSPIHGYGVFTDVLIKQGDIVEECVVPSQVIEHGIENLDGREFATNNATLNKYRFLGPPTFKGMNCGHPYYYIVPAGYAMIYNHSEKPNTSYVYKQTERIMVFRALRNIEPGEELLTDYGPKYGL